MVSEGNQKAIKGSEYTVTYFKEQIYASGFEIH